MAQFKVSCLKNAPLVAKDWGANHVISLLDPILLSSEYPHFDGLTHAIFHLFDQESKDVTKHFNQVVLNIIDVLEPLVKNDNARVLIHCHAGVSRSTAITYIACAMQYPIGREREAFIDFMSLVEKPWPNRRIVECGDNILGRHGKLLVHIDAMRDKYPKRLAAYRRLNIRRGLVSPVKR
ncbi:dual specificity protein phosphatase family protein [Aeromonas enteropelogenes]|uniref:dual specificity protein phosphatase family protein n=1 Tax=Aeromonas enteropelogenes TaxID=29489 RepID=UPI00398A4D6A